MPTLIRWILQGEVRAGRRRVSRHAARGRGAARVRVDEVVPGLDRSARAAHGRPGGRDRRARARRCSSSATSTARPVRPAACSPARSRSGSSGSAAAGASATERRVKVLVVSGIWPPDVGGPASHAPEVAGWLRDARPRGRGGRHRRRGARGRGLPGATGCRARCRRASVTRPRCAMIVARARRADVVYSTGMFGRSSLGALLARTPLVLKLTADPAFERARRRGLVDGRGRRLPGGRRRAARGGAPPAARDAAVAPRRAHRLPERVHARARGLVGRARRSVSTLLPNPAPRVAGRTRSSTWARGPCSPSRGA